MSYQTITDYPCSASLINYGDGIFETMLGVGGSIHNWHYHWARLERGCHRLEIALPDKNQLFDELSIALENRQHAVSVIKMIVSRGEGLRGYRSMPSQACWVQFSVSEYSFNSCNYGGLRVRICDARLSQQPLLAGLKHCNRLEYVMARREAEDSAFDEGLLLDYDNYLIEGLVSNVFIINGANIITPLLKHSGVAGTMRAFLIDNLCKKTYSVNEQLITRVDLAKAESIFISNATNGVMPVKFVQGIDRVYDTKPSEDIRHQSGHPSVC